jgi:eukaryotic-like serine/threonine-protein kinase
VQLARYPREESVGKNYRHRDYFHGQGLDYAPEDPRCLTFRPLSKPEHMSVVYQSTNSNHYMVAFSTPIHAQPADEGGGVVIGVLSMAVHLHELEFIDRALLVDLHVHPPPGAPRGVIIFHRKLGQRDKESLPPSIAEEDLQVADALALRLPAEIQTRGRQANCVALLEKFRDPLNGRTPRSAAVRPIRTSPDDTAHWAIIVTEHAD